MLQQILNEWDNIIQRVKTDFDMSDVSFKTWIIPLRPYSFENDTLSIVVPGEKQSLLYIEKKYTFNLRVTISDYFDHDIYIKFIPEDSITSEIPIINHPSEPVVVDDTLYKAAGINQKYTFDTFVVGSNNSFAHAAALAVAESPGEIEKYNPLFIHGGVGLGKTHLMHSVGNFVLNNNPSLKVMYVTSEVFMNELIESIKNEKSTANQNFRDKYRKIDVLLIDDIQFLIGKESTQDEFFNTFNALKEAKKQIIITSDRSPKNFESLEERLRSRLEWGLLADISPPNYETRMAILHKKAEIEGYEISDDIYDYIATNVKSNIRELEGSLTKLVAYSKFTHSDITKSFAEDVLKDIISPNAHRDITPELIIQFVADHYKVTPADISSQKRNSNIVTPRQVAMYLCRELTDVPLETIGSYMGKRDHSTIKYGVDKIAKDIKTNETLKSNIDSILKKINPS